MVSLRKENIIRPIVSFEESEDWVRLLYAAHISPPPLWKAAGTPLWSTTLVWWVTRNPPDGAPEQKGVTLYGGFVHV